MSLPVTAVDWGAVLADLERERAELDAVIATIRRRAVDPVLAGAPRPSGNGKPGNGKPRATYGKVSPAQWADARVLWDRGDATKLIAAKLKITVTSVYDHAKAHHWPKRPRRAGAVPRGEQLGGRVRCPHCEQITTVDPCQHCGKTVRQAVAG